MPAISKPRPSRGRQRLTTRPAMSNRRPFSGGSIHPLNNPKTSFFIQLPALSLSFGCPARWPTAATQKLRRTKISCVATFFLSEWCQLRAKCAPINFSSILLLWWKLAQSQWIALFFGRSAAPLLAVSGFPLATQKPGAGHISRRLPSRRFKKINYPRNSNTYTGNAVIALGFSLK